MSSEFSGGVPGFFAGRSGGNGTSLNPQQQFPLRSPLSGIAPDAGVQIRGPEMIGKRSLAEFQQQQGEQGGLGFYLRNVKSRTNYHHESPISPLSMADLSPVPFISQNIASVSNSGNRRYGLPVLQPSRVHPLTHLNRAVNNASAGVLLPNTAGNAGASLDSEVLGEESEKKMMSHRLQELEKELLEDGDDEEAASVVTNSEWSETIQNLIDPARRRVSLSPTSSSSSSCSSTSTSPITCTKQHFVDAAAAISEGKFDIAAEILARLQQIANPRGTAEQRLTTYMVAALKSRLNSTEYSVAASELYGKEHMLSIQNLYDASPCFKLGFMAANLAILEATEQVSRSIHVVDLDIGQGGQYVHLLHALAGKTAGDSRAAALKITTFSDLSAGSEERLRNVGEVLKASASKIGVGLKFSVVNFNIRELSRENLGIDRSETLAVNLAFKLYRLPDESVTTENLRDELLRSVKQLSPAVMTVVEQEMNGNTAPLTVRVREACEHYGALFESLEATVARESSERARIEAAVGRRMGNAVACEGRERVERCEVSGKWRARMRMAGFEAIPMSQVVGESLRAKLNSGTRVNPGFTVSQQSGSLCFGWMSRILTVASAWC
ncbi:scarecrow-like protein 8 [Andrographis paniculata]|uniref:scarecrow-like protein 8 n=1 Tax=Andrographis paniculata TaxID=175694 RepID=UPI0021E7F0F2|nr:scarecrow-like protein 8 [Andrographis paniculata]